MKITIAGMILLFALGAKSTDLLKVRTQFFRASQEESEAELFVRSLEQMQNRPVIFTGYLGMGYFLLAKHAGSPFAKLAYFRKGKALLESAIAQSGSNLELRFLRLTVQKSAPSFLNYAGNIDEDTALVKRAALLTEDADLKRRIADFFARAN